MDAGVGGGGFRLLTWHALSNCEPERDYMGQAVSLDQLGPFPKGIPYLSRWDVEVASLDLASDMYKQEVLDNSDDMEMDWNEVTEGEPDADVHTDADDDDGEEEVEPDPEIQAAIIDWLLR